MTARKAQRLKKIENLKKKDRKTFSFNKLWLVFGLVIIAVIVFILLGKGTWDGESQLSMAFGSSQEDVLVITVDPDSKKIVTIRIPKETTLDVANQLGSWPAGSVWDLGENENLGGTLLANSITKTFKFPIESWGSYNTLRLIKGNFFDKLSVIFSFDSTNLSFVDKIRLAILSLQTPSAKRIEIDLADSSYLNEMKNFEGEIVYHLQGDIPTSILKIFSDSTASAERLRIGIVNSGVNNEQINEVTKVMEVLGTKVLSIRNSVENSDIDCEIRSNKKSVTESKIAKIFDCKEGRLPKESNLDLEIEFGEGFASRF